MVEVNGKYIYFINIFILIISVNPLIIHSVKSADIWRLCKKVFQKFCPNNTAFCWFSKGKKKNVPPNKKNLANNTYLHNLMQLCNLFVEFNMLGKVRHVHKCCYPSVLSTTHFGWNCHLRTFVHPEFSIFLTFACRKLLVQLLLQVILQKQCV